MHRPRYAATALSFNEKNTKDTQTVVGDRKFTNTEGRDEKKLRKKREAFARDQASRRRVWRVLGALAVLLALKRSMELNALLSDD